MIAPNTLTLYNKAIVAGKETFRRTVIPGVKWENRKAANILQSGLQSADSVAVYIPMQGRDGYLSPKQYESAESKVGKWTLAVGDYMVKGEVPDEIVGAVGETPAFTTSNLKNKYDDVVRITTVDTMDAGSPHMHHWQVGAS